MTPFRGEGVQIPVKDRYLHPLPGVLTAGSLQVVRHFPPVVFWETLGSQNTAGTSEDGAAP